MIRLARVAAIALAGAAAGCGSGAPAVGERLADVVVADVGEPGFRVEPGATGAMSLSVAARATTLPAAELEPVLERAGYEGGWSRVQTRGDEFVSVIALQLGSAAAAADVVTAVFDRLATSVAYRSFTDPDLPDARGFTLTSDVAGETRFCAGEWFTLDRRAFAVTRCAPFVLSVPAVTGIAAAQRSAAEEAA